ncbi:Rpa49 subunit specific to nuclear RNA polymerase I [Crepidotus variabilis]|uniref:Rpa49 subunit specific to nuclear RNA polymerase I n=1 Tax=Crepidotus variabilis TaxID=179855 RepID=A0A9P6JM86_9AGAR|nr:Rpa49 subunit specific to nuclear RNA polymerase I [Crepidotus variabilis]
MSEIKSKSGSKKRKRDESPESRFELSSSVSGKIGPLLVSYPAVQAPESTAFKCYSRKRSKNDEEEQNLLVVGETSSVEFVSNEDECRRVAESGCRYLLAVRNKRTGIISLLPTTKTPHILKHTVKALKSIPSSAAPSKVEFVAAKNTLGETFGTKKQKANIKAQERNKIDVGAMEGVMGYVMDSIDKGAENLMTAEEAKEVEDTNRLIPPFSATATSLDDVYPLHDLIPEPEWKALIISPFDAAETYQERVALLPFRQSYYLHDHLKALSDPTAKSRKKNTKILLYISAMLAFRKATEFKKIEKEKVYERLSGVPGIVIDSLLSRFTETSRGSSSYQATSSTKTSLLTHIFALCLKLDNYATDTKLLAHDLSMPPTEVNQLFQSLGCKMTKLGERERARLGLGSDASENKRAVLTAPVEFPKPKRRRNTRK